VLCCAVLCCAVLCCAALCCAVLCCAVLCCAVLCCAVLCSGLGVWVTVTSVLVRWLVGCVCVCVSAQLKLRGWHLSPLRTSLLRLCLVER
jgi:hypothetical protein